MHKLSQEQLNKWLTTLQRLYKQENCTDIDHSTLEQIDHDFTTMLTQADQACIIPNAAVWSPIVHTKYRIWKFWKLSMNRVKRHHRTIPLSPLQQRLRHELSTDQIDQGDSTRSTRQQYRIATKNLIETRKEADKKREEHLQRRIHGIEEHNPRLAKIIEKIHKQEQLVRCYTRMKCIKKQSQFTGGISHVLQERENGTILTRDTEGIQNLLLGRNRVHFSQAEGTPLTIEPLLTQLRFGGNTTLCNTILSGETDLDYMEDTPIKSILIECRQVRSPLPIKIPYSAMIQGFKK